MSSLNSLDITGCQFHNVHTQLTFMFIYDLLQMRFSMLLSELNPNLKLLCLIIGAWILFYICRLYLSRIIVLFTSNFTGTWSTLFSNSKLVSNLSWLLPVGVIHSGTKM